MVVDYKVDNLHNIDIPTDVIMLLGQSLNDFKNLILKYFEGKNYKTKRTDIQGGQNLCVESSYCTSQGRPIVKCTIKFYSRLKKVMVQGTTDSLKFVNGLIYICIYIYIYIYVYIYISE